jgi:hypothetical protein
MVLRARTFSESVQRTGAIQSKVKACTKLSQKQAQLDSPIEHPVNV